MGLSEGGIAVSDANRQDRLDRATAARLSKLASRPINTQRLEDWVEQALRELPIQEQKTSPFFRRMRWRPIMTAAAIVIMVAIGWLVLGGDTTPVMAAPADLARIHFDVANGLAPHLTASSVAEANRLLSNQSNGALPVPELPGEILSCCLHQYAATTMTCVLIKREGKRITVAIAEGAKLHSPDGKTVNRDGKEFIAHTVNGINMVMTHEGDRWLCVMAEVATEELIEVAVNIRL